jgi:purine-binding chemotaxis protein CheW
VRDRKHNTTTVAPKTLQLVTFTVGAAEYGLGISSITEVIRPLPVTPLPHMPLFIEGVINLRGVIIPVVDLRKRFGAPVEQDNARSQRMLIIRGAARGLLGLAVDGVREVLLVPESSIAAAPEEATGKGADFIAGVAKVTDRLVVLIDISRILSVEERASLTEAGDVPA